MLNLVTLSLAALGALAVADGEDADKLPADWRDGGRPELRKHWDRLEGRPAPALNDLSQWLQTKGRSWEDYRGKVVLLDMWATWCGPCLAGIPKLEALHEKYADDGLVILGVHSANGFKKMKRFVKSRELPYAFAADTKGKLGSALGVRFIPCYFVIDRNGVVRVAGADRTKLELIVKALLKEPAPETVVVSGESGSSTASGTGSEIGSQSWPPHVKKKLYATKDLRGKQAPSFQVAKWLTEEPSRAGKVVLIDFWATWCPPCREAIPELAKLQKEFADDLVVIGVSDEDPETVKAFMEHTRMGYAQAVDPQERMKRFVGVEGIPHVLLVDSSGIVRWQGYPFDPGDPLTADVIRSVIDLDPGVAQRRTAEQGEKTAGR